MFQSYLRFTYLAPSTIIKGINQLIVPFYTIIKSTLYAKCYHVIDEKTVFTRIYIDLNKQASKQPVSMTIINKDHLYIALMMLYSTHMCLKKILIILI